MPKCHGQGPKVASPRGRSDPPALCKHTITLSHLIFCYAYLVGVLMFICKACGSIISSQQLPTCRTPAYADLCRLMPPFYNAKYATLCYATRCHTMPRHAMLHYVTWHTTVGHSMVWHDHGMTHIVTPRVESHRSIAGARVAPTVARWRRPGEGC